VVFAPRQGADRREKESVSAGLQMFLLKGRDMTKRFSLTIFIFMFASLLALGQEPTALRQIKEALMLLRDRLRDGATVVLEAIPGKRIVLRKGTNGIICRANTTAPGFNVY
jgi:hypothetical protein